MAAQASRENIEQGCGQSNRKSFYWGLTPAVLYTESCTNCKTIRTRPALQRAHILEHMYSARAGHHVTYKRGPWGGVTWDAPRSPVWHRLVASRSVLSHPPSLVVFSARARFPVCQTFPHVRCAFAFLRAQSCIAPSLLLSS